MRSKFECGLVVLYPEKYSAMSANDVVPKLYPTRRAPLAKVPMKDAEVAAVLVISNAQAKAWLLRLLDEGVIEKQKKPAGYIAKQSSVLE